MACLTANSVDWVWSALAAHRSQNYLGGIGVKSSWVIRAALFLAAAFALGGCITIGEAAGTINDFATLRIDVLTEPGTFDDELSVLFNKPDITTFGLPLEETFVVSDPIVDTNRARISATPQLLEHFVENDETSLDLGCFESSIDIRDDETGEILLSVTDYCPQTSVGGFVLRVTGVLAENDVLGWSYSGKDGRVEVIVDDRGLLPDLPEEGSNQNDRE